MGQPTERDTAPEPLTPGTADAPSHDTADDDAPYVPPVKAYERPPVGYRPSSASSEPTAPPTQTLPVVVGQVALPRPPAERTAPPAPVATPQRTTSLPLGSPPAMTTPSATAHAASTGAGSAPGTRPTASSSPVDGAIPSPAGPFAATPIGTVAAPGSGAGNDSPLGGLVGDGQPSRAPKALLTVVGILVVLAGLYTGAQWFYSDKVPAGTHVAGVDVGGLSTAEAVDQLSDGLGPRAREPIELTAGQAQTTLDPAVAGLTFDAEATVARLTGFSMDPMRLWAHVFGGDDVEPVVEVDEAKLDEAVAGLVESLAVAPVDGTVGFTDGSPVATPAVDGTAVPADVAAEAIAARWLVEPGPFDLATEPVAPDITQEETDAALAQAQQIVSAPVTVAVGDQHPELPTEALAAVASFQPVDGDLQLTFDGPALVDGVVTRTQNLLTEPDDAHFEFRDGRPVIVGGEPGTTLDPDAVAAAVQTAALGTDRTAAVELVQRDPEQTREALEALGVNEVVSHFATPLTREPVRTENLRRGAELLTGTLIRPGETFSLIDTLSPIDASNGFRSAGVISNGVHTEGMGGGLSQMATTTYNAGFFAGFEDVEHRPHSVHFERYPAGREATIVVGALDMRFKNNSPYGAVMQSWIEGGQLHVQIWGTKHFRVETSASDRRNFVPTTTVHRSGADCIASPGGAAGFTITNYRKVFDPSGTLVIDESSTWTYRPDNPVVCDPPPAEPAAPEGQ